MTQRTLDIPSRTRDLPGTTESAKQVLLHAEISHDPLLSDPPPFTDYLSLFPNQLRTCGAIAVALSLSKKPLFVAGVLSASFRPSVRRLARMGLSASIYESPVVAAAPISSSSSSFWSRTHAHRLDDYDNDDDDVKRLKLPRVTVASKPGLALLREEEQKFSRHTCFLT